MHPCGGFETSFYFEDCEVRCDVMELVLVDVRWMDGNRVKIECSNAVREDGVLGARDIERGFK